MNDTILEVDGLTVTLGRGTILSDLSFALARGDCVGLLGETGSGKSMTCRALLGLQHRIGGRVTQGHILFNGRDLAGLSEREWTALRGREIAMVPQASMNSLNPLRRVGTQIAETIRVLDPGASERIRTVELLEQVDLNLNQTGRLYPHELSGGMRQRVMIALALAGRPSLLIADEPTTALDVTVQRRILRLFDSLRTSIGMSMIFVSHDLSVLRQVSQNVVVIYAGRSIERGPIAAVLDAPAHPYTHALRDARPDPSAPRARLVAIPGTPPMPWARLPGCPFGPRCPHVTDECRDRMPELRAVGVRHDAACVLVGGESRQ
jgi:peptide/nickel transport system ATP-binding protein